LLNRGFFVEKRSGRQSGNLQSKPYPAEKPEKNPDSVSVTSKMVMVGPVELKTLTDGTWNHGKIQPIFRRLLLRNFPCNKK
jgi:hypothetical protein